MLIFKAYIYNFLLLLDKVDLLLFNFVETGEGFKLEALETVGEFLEKHKVIY